MSGSLETIRAMTWDGKPSFAMLGIYGVDSTGRWVLTREGRYQIPDDAIVLRAPAPVEKTNPPAAEPAQPPEPAAPAPVSSTRPKPKKRR